MKRKKVQKITKAVHTIEELAVRVDRRFDDFAGKVQSEFLAVHEKMDKGFGGVNERLDNLETEVKALRRDLEDLKLRVDQTVYRFEFKESSKNALQRLRQSSMQNKFHSFLSGQSHD